MSNADWSFLAPARRLAWDFAQAQALAGLALPPSHRSFNEQVGPGSVSGLFFVCPPLPVPPDAAAAVRRVPLHVIGMRYARMRRVADDLTGFFQAMMRADAIQRALGPGFAPIRATFEPW